MVYICLSVSGSRGDSGSCHYPKNEVCSEIDCIFLHSAVIPDADLSALALAGAGSGIHFFKIVPLKSTNSGFIFAIKSNF